MIYCKNKILQHNILQTKKCNRHKILQTWKELLRNTVNIKYCQQTWNADIYTTKIKYEIKEKCVEMKCDKHLAKKRNKRHISKQLEGNVLFKSDLVQGPVISKQYFF